MFTTFRTSEKPAARGSIRPRRNQVSRACGWCQTYRIKCDDQVPCRNCVAKGRECAAKGANDLRTFSLAVKEINRLKSRITELEEQLSNTCISQTDKISVPSLPEHLDPLREHGGNRGSWEYIYSKIQGSQHAQSYGPSSSFYFMRNMSIYIQNSLAPGDSVAASREVEHSTLVPSLFFSFDSKLSSNKKTSLRRTNSTGQTPLSRWQEEDFLDLFWQSYHLIYPILDEEEFRTHPNSIWIMPYEPRKPSALVDIVLGITMQYATALMPDRTKVVLTADEKGKDAANAGRSYYRRCQALVVEELENPSLTTLQCQVLSVIYLLNVGS